MFDTINYEFIIYFKFIFASYQYSFYHAFRTLNKTFLMTKQEVKLRALELATKVAHNEKYILKVSKDIYEWLIEDNHE